MGQLLNRLTVLVGAAALAAAAQAAAQPPMPVNERGSAAAPVTIVEYCNYELDACARLEVIVNGVLASFPADRIRFVFRHAGVDATPAASTRYRAALAAGPQGGFWMLHDTMLANRDRASKADVLAMAAQVGLDATRLSADMESVDAAAAAARDLAAAAADGVSSVPAILVNGRPVAVKDAKDLRSAIAGVLGR